MFFNHIETIKIPEAVDTTPASGKRFYTTPDGNKYTSITTMLGAKEKPWLKDWQQMLGKDKAAKETKRCADRGTAIHEMAERYLNNEEYPKLTKTYLPEHIAGFNQLRTRLNHINNIRGQELPLYSDDLKLAGRVDCIGEYDGELAIIDFKTSNNNKDRDMIEDYFLQCTAYAVMWYEMTGEWIENIVILMSVEKGMMPLIFKAKVDKYVEPLVKRAVEFHNKQR